MISNVYLCKNKQTGTTKSGKTYYNLELVDKTGSIAGKVWELSNAIGHFESKNFIKVDGQVTSFNNELQLNIKKIRIADEGEYSEADYMPCTKKDIEQMYICQGIQESFSGKIYTPWIHRRPLGALTGSCQDV